MLYSGLTHIFQNGINQSDTLTACYKPLIRTSAGTAAGGILGPLVYIIFINDLLLPYSSKYCVAYADNVSLISYDNTAEKIVEQLQELLDIANLWFSTNYLCINSKMCA